LAASGSEFFSTSALLQRLFPEELFNPEHKKTPAFLRGLSLRDLEFYQLFVATFARPVL
jgi:hypothetical protein